MSWRNIHVGREGDHVKIDGVEVWRERWRWIEGKTVSLPNPFDSASIHSFMICEAGPAHRPARFAAAELSDGLWAFYVPEGSGAP